MIYNNTIKQRIAKYKSFLNNKSTGQILAIITPYTFEIDYSQCGGLEDKPLNVWDFDKEADCFAEDTVNRLKYFIEYTKDLDNDYIPSLSAGLGIGAHSAYFSGQNIIFGQDTSWSHPCIKEWDDIYKLSHDENNKWFILLKNITSKMVSLCEGDYVVGSFGHFAPMDMANALRGNQLFYDFFDEPGKVHELMNISANAIVWLHRELEKITGQIDDGSVAGGMWFPGKALFMSEDAPDLCSPDIYKEFGFPYTQKVIDEIGGAYIHHHAKGWHVHSDIAKLNKLNTLEISWDPNCPRPIDHIAEIYEKSNGLPVMTRCTADDVYNKIDQIKKGRCVLMLNIKDLTEGYEVMNFIRQHSKI